jgi:SP family general alpha glucoside:H+ symporter-like MFS transporter
LYSSIPCGFFITSASSYVSEVSPTVLKPYLTTYINLCWVIGHLIAAGVLAGMVNMNNQWSYRIPFAIQWVWPLPLAVACMFAPESPWWLARKDRLVEAEASLRRLCSAPEDVINQRQTLAMINETLRLEKDTLRIQGGYLDCFKGTNLRRTEIAMVSWGCQILPGFIIQNYSTYFFTLAGLPAGNAFKMSVGELMVSFLQANL